MNSSFNSSRKFALSISAWFCVPEQGMKEFEILSRASAFLLKRKSPSFKSKMHVLTASHVVAPWRFPKYYPQEWLQFVNEKNTHYTVEVRHDDGVFLTQACLAPFTFIHPTRDLAVLHLETEDDDLEVFQNTGFSGLDLHLYEKDLEDGQVGSECWFS